MAVAQQIQFLWHFHQPYYGIPGRGVNLLPWVRLHAVKSYYDMARMLEQYPGVRAVVNFSGSLLKQLREYVEDGRRDTWWELSLKPADALTDLDRQHLLRHFFSINWDHCIRPYSRYWELLQKRGTDPREIEITRFSDQDLRDLQVWFNLAWFGFSAREERGVLRELIRKGRGYTEAEKEAVLEQQIDVMKLVIPLYRKLYGRDQVEISVTPMYHPILPLIIDSESASRATPARPRPTPFEAPEDAAYHVRAARDVAIDFLGIDVDGMWPAEGAVSPEAIDVFAEHDVRWVASDEDVLRESRGPHWHRSHDLYRPWRLRGRSEPAIFFRDHAISDQLGFVYAKNRPDEAVDDLLGRLQVAGGGSDAPPLVSVILDGENPWEHYPEDGREFLDHLYRRLSESDTVETTTPSRYLDEFDTDGTLDSLHSGSWIHGNYAIWIGHAEENAAWNLLGRARRALCAAEESGDVSGADARAAWEAIRVAEGSDWFWWYGDDFDSGNDLDFDRLFRDHLRFVYQTLGREEPQELNRPIKREKVSAVAFEPPTGLISPEIDGRTDYFYEWSGAGVYRNTGSHGSMFENTRYVDEIFIGFDLATLYLRAEWGPDLDPGLPKQEVRVGMLTERGSFRAELTADNGGTGILVSEAPEIREPLEKISFGGSLELAIPFELLEVRPGEPLRITFAVWNPGMELERHPRDGGFEITVPDKTFEGRNWLV